MNTITIYILFAMFLSSCNIGTSEKLEVYDFKNKLEASNNPLLIDIRKTEEYNYGHIRNAININWLDDGFFDRISTLDKNKPTFVYCLTGSRAEQAADNMRKLGFKKVYELKGGILTWRKAGFPEEGEPIATTDDRNTMDSIVKTGKTILVDFSAKWCKPCQALSPVIEEIVKESAGKVILLKIDVDKNHALVQDMNVGNIPMLYVYKNGQVIWKNVGVTSKSEILKHLE